MKRFIFCFIVFGFISINHGYAQPYMLKEGQSATQIRDGKISFNNSSEPAKNVKNKTKKTQIIVNGRVIKRKKYPSLKELYYEELYPEYGTKTIVNAESGKYLLWENGARFYYKGEELLYPDGTIKKMNGSIVLADGTEIEHKGERIRLDGTQVDENGIPIKGAPKVKPVVYSEGNKSPDEVLGLPKKKTK